MRLRFTNLLMVVLALAVTLCALDANAGPAPIIMAQQAAPPPAPEPATAAPRDDSPEAKMARRFPQPVKVGDLIGLPVLDDNDVTLGHVQQVVRDPQGKINLIVSYSKWFGWFGRPVAVPIEVVAILAKQIASVDMEPAEYAEAPTWKAGADTPIPASDMIRIAVTRR
jgi:PRC-barrel domain